MQTIQKNRYDISAIAFAMVVPTLITLIYFVWLSSSPSSLQQTAYAIGKIIQFGFPILFVWIFHRQRLRLFHSEPTDSRRDETSQSVAWIMGVAFGLLVVAAMLIAWFAWLAPTELGHAMADEVRNKISGMGLGSVWSFLAVGVFYSVIHSFLEEYYWRWFVFRQLQPYTSTLQANLISSVGFMAHHVILLATFFGWSPPLTWLFSACIAFGGVVWAWLYDRSRQLRHAWLSHAIVDAGIFSLGYLIARDLF